MWERGGRRGGSGGGYGNEREESGIFVLPGSKGFGGCSTKGTVLKSKGKGKDRLPDRGNPVEVAGMGVGGIVNIGVEAEASGHAFNV
jgi:hypothetical protein